MDSKLFLGTARFLKDNCKDEAAFRSAISRAYYACFITTRDIAMRASQPKSIKKAGGKIRHESLQNFLKKSLKKEVQKLGIDLAGLCGNRVTADYNMSKPFTSDDAESAILDAEAFLKDLDKIPIEEIGKAVDDFQNTLP